MFSSIIRKAEGWYGRKHMKRTHSAQSLCERRERIATSDATRHADAVNDELREHKKA